MRPAPTNPYECELCQRPIKTPLKGEYLCFRCYDWRFQVEADARLVAKRPPVWWRGQRGQRYSDEPV